ncbi:glycoside hydrolase family 36 protein [Aliagarivorans marinus]|uniref:glycoside hydrolase family 36 protein n=1 Tax=Aliagarivorans marinus TaxID=561965 RepID=UPI00042831C6|nr:alpha-galactosidase [Aliagarivorans marinus]
MYTQSKALAEVRSWRQHHPDYLLTHQWFDNCCQVRIDNLADTGRRPGELILFNGRLPEHRNLYMEGWQMLAQSLGNSAALEDVGRCPDNQSYRLASGAGAKRGYNLLLLEGDEGYCLIGFASCLRFAGFFDVYPDGTVAIGMDAEQLAFAPRSYWLSEAIVVLAGPEREALLSEFAQQIQQHHPQLPVAKSPTGWCSWYHYYADVSEQDVRENLQQMQQSDMDYLLIDDGYQAFMGDWLSPSDKFAAGGKALCQQIALQGKQPAIWLAPFIAQPESQLFRDHPDWFVKGDDGQPLAAELVTYGGWRCTPWYVLDTTQAGPRDYLRSVFREMREQWGVRYFKLDALYWGVLPGGYRADASKSRIEAFRLGMQAMLEGAGEDSFILGCNAAFWPSLGLVHGMRIGDDVERNRGRFAQIAKECFLRNWQHQQLWQNDPDCITLSDIPGQNTDSRAYNWHRVSLMASSGLMFSGDRLANLQPVQWDTLNTLISAQLAPAQFHDLSLATAVQYQLGEAQGKPQHSHSQPEHAYFFNWQGDTQELTQRLEGQWQVLWGDDDALFTQENGEVRATLAGHSALLLQRKS